MKLKTLMPVVFLCISFQLHGQTAPAAFIAQSKRDIPVVQTVDVLIIGGTTAAVSAAVSASEKGAKVYLVSQKPYLGEDLCATLRLKIKENRSLKTGIEKSIFDSKDVATPIEVKGALNNALLQANVQYVFGSFVTDILWDDNNDPAGVVIANRAGRQAIIAKAIIDATDRAWVCRMAGAKAYEWHGNEIEFQRIVVMPGKEKDDPEYVLHKLTIPMADLHFPSFANAEQIARAKTYTEGQLRASESLFHIPPDPIVCERGSKKWDKRSGIEAGHFKVRGINNLYVLSGCADIPRSVAESMLEPAGLTEAGEIVGQSAGLAAMRKAMPKNVLIKENTDLASSRPLEILAGDIKETLTGFRPVNNVQQTVVSPEIAVPAIGDYDVVVIGGGTSGAPAAIGAGWWGMKVLVVEYLEGLGGIGTLGLIGKPWYGQDVGFAAEVPFPEGNIEPKMEWYRSQLEKVGADIWLGALGCGAYVEGNEVKGAVVVTPQGRMVVRADIVIDATGNADVAIAAGARYMYGDIENERIALQGTGLSSRPLTGNYNNTDYLLVDESDMVDVWRTLVSVHITKAQEETFDAVPIIQNRERRRIVGDFVLDYLDQIAGRTYPDAIVYSESDYDSHGYPSSMYFALLPHDEVSRKQNHPAPGGTCFTPYRCLLPKGLEGILVTGLGISMDRDASALVRMQLDMANQGYAAGVAAMLAITNQVHPRYINVKELQRILIEKGNLPDSVLHMKDSFPLSAGTIEKAIESYGQATNPETAGKPLAIILSHKEKAMPMLKEAYRKATGNSKLLYAQVLGMLGEKDGVPVLLAELEKFTKWDDKILQGKMADYAHLPTPIDAIILSLGNSGDKSVLQPLLNLVETLDQHVTLSHHRALAIALETIADPSAAAPLARLLQKPGMKGHAMTELQDALTDLDNNGRGPNPVNNTSSEKRTRSLREIILARALFKCGDHEGLAKSILESYAKDMRGLFARHAMHILKQSNHRI